MKKRERRESETLVKLQRQGRVNEREMRTREEDGRGEICGKGNVRRRRKG